MIGFKEYIEEDVSLEKLTHLSHLEDLPILYGRDGARRAVKILNSIISKSKGIETQDIEITTKFDGSPSLIVGTNPENGKFFVGTKSVFNKLSPKINYTFADIEKNHDQPDLRKKLKYALKYLKELNIKNVIQGDMMFVQGDVKTKKIDGVDSLVFRPNTITYVVPKDSELGKQISRAKVGIIFHTTYKGSSINNLKATLNVDTRELDKTPDVWYEDANFQMIKQEGDQKGLDKKTLALIEKDMNNLKFAYDRLDKVLLDKIESDNELKNLILQFINFLVRTDNNKLSPKEKLKLFAKYLRDKYSGEAGTRKTDKGKDRVGKRLGYIQGIVKHNLRAFVVLLGIHRIIADVKLHLINGLQQKQDLKPYLEINDKFVKTSPEGFVAVSDSLGTVKLIDRDSFSKHNFNLEKNWDK